MNKKRWSCEKKDYVENKKIDSFMEDLFKLYKKHDLSISHEDGHGAFIIEKMSDDDVKWMSAAHIGKSVKN
jgi:DUF4097 and DUF4098 domain-containing protein YvlB